MNKKTIVVCLLIIGITLGSCSNRESSLQKSTTETISSKSEVESILEPEIIDVSNLDTSTADKALNRLRVFKQNFDNGKTDRVIISSITFEGDPITQEIKSDGSTISYLYDNSEDGYSSTPGVEMYTSDKIILKKEEVEGKEHDAFYIIDGNEEILIW